MMRYAETTHQVLLVSFSVQRQDKLDECRFGVIMVHRFQAAIAADTQGLGKFHQSRHLHFHDGCKLGTRPLKLLWWAAVLMTSFIDPHTHKRTVTP